MRRLSVAALACLSACAQLFGIDETTGHKPPDKVALTLTRQSVGAAVISAPLDVTAEMATFYIPDSADPTVLDAVPGVQSATNMWEGDVPTGNPFVQYSAPDLPTPFSHVVALPSRDIRTHHMVFEHPNPTAPPPSAMEQVTMMLPTPYDGMQVFDVFVVGAWMQHRLAGAELPDLTMNPSLISTTIPYAMFQVVTASPPAAIAANDAVLVLRHSGNQLTGVYQQPGFDQSPTMDTIGGAVTMQEVALDKTLSATISPATYSSRFDTVRPGVAPASLGMAWTIVAAPGYQLPALVGPLLNAGNSAMADSMVSATFGNPFESLSWHALLQFSVTETRTFMMGTNSVTLFAQLVTLIEPAMASNLDLPAPLPEQIALDSHQLNSDGSNVALDITVPHSVSLLVEGTPPAQVYFVDVIELVVNGAAVERHIIVDARGTDPTIVLPPGTFKIGSTYTLSAGTITGGRPNAAIGDLDTTALPLSASQVDSGLFTVVSL
jgi:hypothetical protein